MRYTNNGSKSYNSTTVFFKLIQMEDVTSGLIAGREPFEWFRDILAVIGVLSIWFWYHIFFVMKLREEPAEAPESNAGEPITNVEDYLETLEGRQLKHIAYQHGDEEEVTVPWAVGKDVEPERLDTVK